MMTNSTKVLPNRYTGSLTESEVPKNVKFMSWLPQSDLLAHNKTKLFITHGGLYGVLFISGSSVTFCIILSRESNRRDRQY